MKKVIFVLAMAVVFSLGVEMGDAVSKVYPQKPRITNAFIFGTGEKCPSKTDCNGISLEVNLPDPPKNWGLNIKFEHRYYGGSEWGLLWIFS